MGKGAECMRHITPQQNAKMRLRTRLLAAVLAVGCLGGLVVRLFILMLRDPGGYAARAADQQLRGATLPAARGEIYSADGTLLAASKTCWTIRAPEPSWPSAPPRGKWPTTKLNPLPGR